MLELLHYLPFLELLKPLADWLGLWGAVTVLWCLLAYATVLLLWRRTSVKTLKFVQAIVCVVALLLPWYGAQSSLAHNRPYVELLELDGASTEQIELFRAQGAYEAWRALLVGGFFTTLFVLALLRLHRNSQKCSPNSNILRRHE